MQPKVEEQREETPEEEQARVFAKLKGMSGGDDKDDGKAGDDEPTAKE